MKIKRRIFQGDSLSLLLFVLVMIPLTLMFSETKACYEVKKGVTKINQLLFMNDQTLFAKDEGQIVITVRIFSEDIKMELGLPKCGVLIIKKEKVIKSEGISMPDQYVITNIDRVRSKYLRISETDGEKHEEMKGQIKKEYIRRVGNMLKSELIRRNIISAIISRAVLFVRYGARKWRKLETINWARAEPEELDRKKRKLMTMHGVQHPKENVERLQLQRSGRGRDLIGLKDFVKVDRIALRSTSVL